MRILEASADKICEERQRREVATSFVQRAEMMEVVIVGDVIQKQNLEIGEAY